MARALALASGAVCSRYGSCASFHCAQTAVLSAAVGAGSGASPAQPPTASSAVAATAPAQILIMAGRVPGVCAVWGAPGSTLGAVTDLESIPVETIGEPAPELIATHYLASIDELVEHLRA